MRSLLILFELCSPGSISFTGENKSSEIKGLLVVVQWAFPCVDSLNNRDHDAKQEETEVGEHLKHPTWSFPCLDQKLAAHFIKWFLHHSFHLVHQNKLGSASYI